MNLAESIPEAVEQLIRDPHRRIDRPRVGDIEAESGLRQLLEHGGELISGPSARIAQVHILEDQSTTEDSICVEGSEGVRMNNDGFDGWR